MNTNSKKAGFTSTLVKLFAAAALVMGAMASQQAVAGISATKHNLGTSGTGTNHLSAGTAEICVFCHTPHGSNTNVAAPLWNKGLPASTYNVYNSNAATATTTIDGAIVPVGSVSLACLSCHDGTQAMDNMINAAGSGGFTAGGATPAGYTWAAGGAAKITGVARLGDGTATVDLTNDHPIGIEYCGGSSTTAYTSATCNDKDFKDATKHASKNLWWVDTTGGTAGTREKTDMILYTRTEATNGNTPKPYVECASCHDPHVEAKAANQVAFLRVSQAGSGVCLACHNK